MSDTFLQKLIRQYPNFKEKALTQRRFVHADIVPLVNRFKNTAGYEVTTIGHSVQNRPIFQVKIGNGPIKILLWSQMHGNEATATMAIFDIFNYFLQKSDFTAEVNAILESCTLYFVPMLNPDGAEVFERRNALGIDLNRDALALQSPEAILLKKLQNDLKPDFGFNLHDQSLRYAVGNTGKQTTMAFLATAYNEAREINPVRKRSMQLIVAMNRILQDIIPGQVARFSDEFEPRAFGDNIQKWGTTLILVESGGYKNDPEKQLIRKLNFLCLIEGFRLIANQNFENENIEYYNQIPENNRVLFDLLIRNATTIIEGKKVSIDIGIFKDEVPANNKRKFSIKSNIEDLGDLHTFFGIDEIEASGMELIAEKPLKLNSKPNFSLLKEGKLVYSIKNGNVRHIKK
jgi:hypothetical protein